MFGEKVYVETIGEANVAAYARRKFNKAMLYSLALYFICKANSARLERRIKKLEEALKDENVYSEKEARDTFKDLNKTLDDILAKFPKKDQKTEEPKDEDESFLE